MGLAVLLGGFDSYSLACYLWELELELELDYNVGESMRWLFDICYLMLWEKAKAVYQCGQGK